jgi:tetratricopeptide (TPR) repeat protein
MLARSSPWIAVLLGIFGTAAAADRCTMVRLPDIPVTMHGLTPLVFAKIDGTKEPLILDSGAGDSTLALAVAVRLNLPRRRAHFDAVGVTGARAVPAIATARTFAFDGSTFHSVDFIVTPAFFEAGAAGLLGQNVLQLADMEYDLANGVVRPTRPVGCGDRPLAYWRTSQHVFALKLQRTSAAHLNLIGRARVNGTPIRVLFDTGAAHSILSLRVANSIGLTPHSSGVSPAGNIFGVNGRPKPVWSATLASFDIGGESILHARVLIGDIEDSEADMILGSDFFLAHRIYVANSQHKLYFTYNGGPVFNLDTPPASGSPAAPKAAAPARASITVLDRAIALDPGDIDARIARAQLSLPRRAAVEADLRAIDHLAKPGDDVRLSTAALYGSLGNYAAAAHQYDVWIEAHQADDTPWAVPQATWAMAFSGRCWTRGAAQLDLNRALGDCDQAVELLPKSAEALDCRALVHLQRGEWGAAIADYDSALKLQPRRVGALYGRGLAEMRAGDAAAARADLAAAVAIKPQIARHFASFGLEP